MCLPSQGCCMGHMHGQWSCCGPPHRLAFTTAEPWNFNMTIKYDVYVWDCSSTISTNVSCILSGRWSLDQITFQLTAIPPNITFILAKYSMKNARAEWVSFSPQSNWSVTVPVNRNLNPGEYNINDELQFRYNDNAYAYYFGYGRNPHCPRC
ncbi:unnamed protein product [Didymodactylos carnosus]|uniref:Uncharacterized protein n=1 Tax=Didymodactylos carnosus TaxID=1234261 RepID=A0A8S2INT3_9BILA|nr:unnamed protein product [Didymodactylos carnosus]CAF3746640.1 unnamed protein product [Didymodactylos carnosus]